MPPLGIFLVKIMFSFFGKTSSLFAFLYCVFFCLGCNHNTANFKTANPPSTVVLEQPIQVDVKLNEETSEIDNSSDCNKPKDEEERLLCIAILKSTNGEDNDLLKEDLQFVSRRVDLNGDAREEIFVWIPTGL